MKTKDRVKEEIGLYRLFMTVALAVLSSLVGWSWNNIVSAGLLSKIIIFLTAFLLSFSVLILFFNIDSKIQELDNYDK